MLHLEIGKETYLYEVVEGTLQHEVCLNYIVWAKVAQHVISKDGDSQPQASYNGEYYGSLH